MKSLRPRALILFAAMIFSAGCNEILGIEPATLRSGGPPSDCNPQCISVQSIAAGRAHTCMLANEGDVFCWGENSEGQLGYGDTNNRGDEANEMGANLIKVDLGTGQKAKEISLGDAHTCALLQSGEVKCWGGNTGGTLGVGDIFTRGDEPFEMGDALLPIELGPGEKAKAISAGDFHTCALLESNTIKCWGLGGSGQLGLGDGKTRGDAASDMGVNLFGVDLGTSLEVLAISAGGSFSCALLNGGSIRCWGANGYGQLGLGDQMARGDNANELGSLLPSISLGTGFKAASLESGGGHSCASDGNSRLKCWGRNDTAQLGLGDTGHRGDSGAEMGDNLPEVQLSGANSPVLKGQAAGSRHHCAILQISNSIVLKCWGDNSQGQCGLPLPNFIGDIPNEMGDQLESVDLGKGAALRAVTAGGSHTCAILESGGIKCWGDNSSGQLGYGDTLPRGSTPDQMGDALPLIALP